jgi:hypothetical protein
MRPIPWCTEAASTTATSPGKRKPKTKRRDLDAALRDCLAGREVAEPVTDAVGCPIEGVRLSVPD